MRMRPAGWVGVIVAAAGAISMGCAQVRTPYATGPDCSGGKLHANDSWAAGMAFTYLKDAGITSNDRLDFTKTRTVRIASEKTGKNLWHQVYDVHFTEKSGRVIEVIAVHDASEEECSMTSPTIYVVSQKLGN